MAKHTKNALDLSAKVQVIALMTQTIEEGGLEVHVNEGTGDKTCKYLLGWDDAKMAKAATALLGSEVNTNNIYSIRAHMFGTLIRGKRKSAKDYTATLAKLEARLLQAEAYNMAHDEGVRKLMIRVDALERAAEED